ncbi:hypothetical protein KSI01_26340 [Kurthia sibirica]|nr:hypothetical protein KSI01_26340 [Kurthia sibirica]
MMKGRNHLVHAVTGAGKTEILFPVIAQALIENWRICIATPRTDVVIELVPRIQQAFTTIEVQALYAGQKKSKKYAQIVIATTHQLYRFEEAFDLIIVDEVDAFPYSKDHYLQHAVNKSCSRVGRLLLLTATPTIQQIASFKKKAAYSFLSRRFHGVALPVPKIQPLWNYERKIRQNIIPKKLIIWIEKCLAIKAPFLLFFSSIDLMLAAEKRLSQQIPQIASVYADDPKRHEKVRKLRQKKYSGLLTTTILERGITIANLQVAVVGAEHAVFTTATLIQISGRVGRSKQFSIGEVVFFHHGITTKMTSCQRIIKKTNKMGYTV